MTDQTPKSEAATELDQEIDVLFNSMTIKQRAFIAHYFQHYNATAAYRHAYDTRKSSYATISRNACALTKTPIMQEAIRLHGRRTMLATSITQEAIAEKWWTIANTPITDIVRVDVPPCRHCYGKGHAYQWTTEREFNEALDQAVFKLCAGLIGEDREALEASIRAGGIDDPSLPKIDGGFGYNSRLTPVNACPECAGRGGTPIIDITDTSLLSADALLLLQGIKQTQSGIELTFADRAKTLENLAKFLGMFAGKVESETENPLERLARRLMAEASTVPVVRDEDLPPDRLYSEDGAGAVGFVSFADDDEGFDDEYVEP